MSAKPRLLLILAALTATAPAAIAAPARPDIVIANFEGPDYGDWKTTGEAFGPGPAQGTLPSQMEVTGFEGKGLVNTYFHGDDTIGTLTSPPFEVQRRCIVFLIGGGQFPGEACINLLVDGKVVRTATGPNDRPGGSERLDWHSWDVADLQGKTATIEIVDQRRGGWGHINIDSITQSDRRRGGISSTRDMVVTQRYLQFVVPAGQGPRTFVGLSVDGRAVRRTAGTGAAKPYWVSWDVRKLKGRTVQVQVSEEDPGPDAKPALAASLAQSDRAKGVVMDFDSVYDEIYRPQFHFTARTGWLNDPNGMMRYRGQYHLFFQHNPKGTEWGNMTWGHAVSTDMVHWKQGENALHPDAMGTMFSGSGVVDWTNTTGFQQGAEKPLVCIYTAAGDTSPESKGVPFTQCLAYSTDAGKTWTKYAGNPVLKHIAGGNRDPKVLWHAPSKQWVMALFIDGNEYALFGSPNLKEWTRLCDVRVPGGSECPDFFELPVDGNAADRKWVFWSANNTYLLGTFDGKTFTQESGPHPCNWGANCYAAQTFSDIPDKDGRRIQIAWMSGGAYPGMPFNQQMSIPWELTLHTTAEGVRLFRSPVRELDRLHGRKHAWAGRALKPGGDLLAGLAGDLFEIRADIDPGKASAFGFTLRGEKVHYDVAAKTLTCLGKTAPLAPDQGHIRLRIFLDRASIEVFGNDGAISMPTCFLPNPADRGLSIYAEGGEAKIRSLEVYELRSIWKAGK